MKYRLTFFAFSIWQLVLAQEYPYNPNPNFPFGRANPNAPNQLLDFEPMIGQCDCKSVTRIDANTWADTIQMTWTFKYIMNGMAVQDETLKADGTHSGSIRLFNTDSAKWYVHYYSTSYPGGPLGVWEGNRKDDRIVLYKDSAAPNGTPGYYRLTFSNFSKNGYQWVGEWVDKSETFVYPTWRIFCYRKGS